MIRMNQVNKVYRTDRIETLALEGIDLTIDTGAFVSVMGPSGCGKTTLLNLIGLLDRPSTGTLEIEGRPVQDCGDRESAQIRNQTIGFIFQSFHLISDLRLVDNVEIPLLYRRMRAAERRQRALAALDRVGLAARAQHFPTQLSGGQQQRAAIARAVAGSPRLLLADEPTGNLDSHMGSEVMDLLQELNREGTTIVMVTHDAQLAERTAQTIRLFDGRQIH